ncbi:plasmid recombination protein, partial [Streptococcus uberis]|uniref:plasmid recombination protein n=1 Tax=Streptococcus uberis TaxID=1349 RepID=UPI001E2C7207
ARRAPRSDAVALVSQTIQIGGDLAEKSLNEQIEVLRACHDFFNQKNGFDNVISFVIHIGETGPSYGVRCVYRRLK